MAAAATFLSQSSLLQSKSSLSLTTLQKNPRALHLPTPSSKLSFVGKRGNRLSARCSAAVTASNSSLPASNSRETKNPIIVIDNYDSFTYNLCQYMGELGCHFEVYRNDELTVEELKRKNPRGVLISPGPGEPQDSGISLQTVLELGPLVPLFGVCMGLQCIGEAFGGKIVRSPYGVMHGKSSRVYYDEKEEDGLFCGLQNPFTVGRYHSLVIEKDSFPSEELEVTAWTEDGLIMAARHKKYKHLQVRCVFFSQRILTISFELNEIRGKIDKVEKVQGVQFHPESIITTQGKIIVGNFIKLIERKEAESHN